MSKKLLLFFVAALTVIMLVTYLKFTPALAYAVCLVDSNCADNQQCNLVLGCTNVACNEQVACVDGNKCDANYVTNHKCNTDFTVCSTFLSSCNADNFWCDGVCPALPTPTPTPSPTPIPPPTPTPTGPWCTIHTNANTTWCNDSAGGSEYPSCSGNKAMVPFCFNGATGTCSTKILENCALTGKVCKQDGVNYNAYCAVPPPTPTLTPVPPPTPTLAPGAPTPTPTQIMVR